MRGNKIRYNIRSPVRPVLDMEKKNLLPKLLLLFILVPAVELILLISIGQWIGAFPTIALIILTGALGAYLARLQGVQVLNQIRGEFRTGRLPAGSLVDGAMVLVAGAFLMTPGILTDALGLLCLIPATRRVIKSYAWTRLERAVRNGNLFAARFQRSTSSHSPQDVVTITPDDYSYRSD